jgi:hypothetical protein
MKIQLDDLGSLPDGPFTTCPYCNQIVEPREPNVQGVEQIPIKTFGEGLAHVEGLGAYFHPTCAAAYKQRRIGSGQRFYKLP